jgi:(R,R)-butanediol dehydrogenase / meso-butanediol dehydrogenase / diacetyl reductase
MKALRWYGRRDLRFEDVPEPSPGPGQVKLKISMVGICGSDLKEYADGPYGISLDKVPLTIGHEFCGKVVELGKGVTGFKVGDRVTAVCYWGCGECYYCKKGLFNICPKFDAIGLTVNGCMAEYMVMPDYTLINLPDSVSDEVAAVVEPLSVALHAIKMGRVQTGDSVVIVGDGTIGLCMLLAARAAGASKVYLVSKHKRRGDAARVMGASCVIDYNEEDPVKVLSSLTGGIGADVSFECVGAPDTPQLAVNLIRGGGVAVIVGLFKDPSAFNFATMAFSEKTVLGSATYLDEGKAAVALLADGRIDASHLITSKVPLKDAVALGFERLLADKENNLKILLQIP